MDWIAFVFTSCGSILNAKKKQIGWWVWIISNCVWILYALRPLQIPIILTQILNIAINIYGIRSWAKK